MPAITNAISKVKLPDEQTARPIFDSNSMHYIGHTTTTIVPTGSDDPTGAVITIGTGTVTAIANDFVTSDNNVNYLFNGTTWDKISEDAATIGNGTITISGDGVDTQTFTVNQTSNTTVTVDVPIKEITVNGAALTPDASNSVDITVPVGPMTLKGTLSTGSTLPTAADTNLGWCYRVVDAGTYGGIDADAGDVIVCCETEGDTYAWVLIPAGDDIDVTEVAAGIGLTTASGSAITTTGIIKLNLKSETALSDAAGNPSTESDSGRVFALAVDSAGKPAVNITPGTVATVLSDVTTSTTIANPSSVTVVTGVTAASGSAATGQTDVNIFSMGTDADAETLILNYARVSTGDSITTSPVSNIVCKTTS